MREKRDSAVIGLAWCFHDCVFGCLVVCGQAVRCDIQLCVERERVPWWAVSGVLVAFHVSKVPVMWCLLNMML